MWIGYLFIFLLRGTRHDRVDGDMARVHYDQVPHAIGSVNGAKGRAYKIFSTVRKKRIMGVRGEGLYFDTIFTCSLCLQVSDAIPQRVDFKVSVAMSQGSLRHAASPRILTRQHVFFLMLRNFQSYH